MRKPVKKTVAKITKPKAPAMAMAKHSFVVTVKAPKEAKAADVRKHVRGALVYGGHEYHQEQVYKTSAPIRVVPVEA